MARLRTILEPGEQVLARTPPRWAGWLTVFAVVAPLVAMLVWIALAADDERLQELVSMLYVFGGLTVLELLLLIPILRWRIVATDRRILVRHGFLRRELKEIGRDAVRAVRQDGHGLVIEGDGREIETFCHPLTAGLLLDAIDPARAPEAPTAGATGGMPAADEPVLLRAKSQLTRTLISMVPGVIPVVAIPYLMLEDITTLDSVELAGLFGFPAFLMAVAGAGIFVASRSQKQWLITGRRIVTLQGVFRRRIEDIRRDWIEETDFDGATLTVKGGGRSLDIPLGEVSADELSRVLGRWFPWRGAPAAPAKALLRNGETLLLRRPRIWAKVAGFVGALLVLVAGTGYLWFRLGEERGLAALTPLFLAMISMVAVLPQTLRESAWSLLVTDRRVLLRRRHDRSRHDELSLGEIDDIEAHTKIRPRVTLRGQGRRFEFPVAGSAKGVERIRDAIAAAKEKSQWRG